MKIRSRGRHSSSHISTETYTFMLWNPCTGESQVLPQTPLHSFERCFWGFGYDSTTDDYKVILGSYKSGHEFVVVFMLKGGSWRKLERLNKYFGVSGAGCSVNQALHWVLREQEDGRFIDSRIVTFDLAEEKFHEIPFPYPPNPVDSHELFAGVGILNNCLTLAFQTMCGRLGCNFKMWVMKDYGVEESWSEVINIPSGIAEDEYVFFTCISENGEVLVQLNLLGSLELYNPEGKTFRTLLDYSGHWYGAATYIETLVSPLMGSAGAIM